jgi:predicted nucleic acid-binding protein
MNYLVDANVLSEATKPDPDPRVMSWLSRNSSRLHVTPIVLGELEYGILLLPQGKKRKRLEDWLADAQGRFPILDFDFSCATAWARLLASLKKNGRAMPIKDSLIAASALVHKLAVATRNTKDFANAGVDVVSPFEADGK